MKVLAYAGLPDPLPVPGGPLRTWDLPLWAYVIAALLVISVGLIVGALMVMQRASARKDQVLSPTKGRHGR